MKTYLVEREPYCRIRLSIACVLPLLLASVSGPAAAATIQNGLGSSICLQAFDDAATGEKQLRLDACNGSESQEFTLQAEGQIRVGTLCVDAGSNPAGDGSLVALKPCDGGAAQSWKRTEAGEFRGVAGKCMDVSGNGSSSVVMLWACRDGAGQKWAITDRKTRAASSGAHPMASTSVTADPCAVKQVVSSAQNGVTDWSPDGKQYVVNKEDASGVAQLYVGNVGSPAVCITCTDKFNGPKASKFKMQPHWHPSGRWIVLAVEQENFTPPSWSTPDMTEGWLQSGLWVDMWATTPDGSEWYKLQDFGKANPADGFTGVAFTPNGLSGVWAQIVDGNIFAYTFGKWRLIMADFQEVNGVPSFTNFRDITPPDTYWVEPGNFSPNGTDLVLSADTGFPDHSQVMGQDQYVLNVVTGQITNLTKSPAIWDEHGVFSPDGQKIVFMSSYPYRAYSWASTTMFLKAEYMIMNKDGSNLKQVTHYNQWGYPEFSWSGGIAANANWNPSGAVLSARQLLFPNYKDWDISFAGNCGGQPF